MSHHSVNCFYAWRIESKRLKSALACKLSMVLRKLGYSLVDQLIFLRNRCDGELPISVSGIYVPIVGAFELVGCMGGYLLYVCSKATAQPSTTDSSTSIKQKKLLSGILTHKNNLHKE